MGFFWSVIWLNWAECRTGLRDFILTSSSTKNTAGGFFPTYWFIMLRSRERFLDDALMGSALVGAFLVGATGSSFVR